jgi:hypothetical protein
MQGVAKTAAPIIYHFIINYCFCAFRFRPAKFWAPAPSSWRPGEYETNWVPALSLTVTYNAIRKQLTIVL